MANTPLLKKLKIQAGQKLLILNAPQGFRQSLGELPENVDISESPSEKSPREKYDFVHIFAADSRELDRLKRAVAASVIRCFALGLLP